MEFSPVIGVQVRCVGVTLLDMRQVTPAQAALTRREGVN